MNINNLVFFDRNGESYNFSQNSDGVWQGADYFLPISTSLYDVSNIYILEKVGNSYKFPTLSPGSSLQFRWRTAEAKDEFFLFTIAKEDPHTDSPTYISRQTSLDINYEDINPGGLNDLDLTYPLQVNVGFSPNLEQAYTRVLDVYYENGANTELVLTITFYGEGEDEDSRFRVWLENFGIKFNLDDALLLKNYDLKEGLPDWKQLNQARKELLVNRDQIYPYVGTYKGLMNLINILGYRDVLRVKEYWQDQDTKSAYYQKYAMVDVTDLMDDGVLDEIDLVDLNGQIKKGGKFKKTELLALAYEFSVASDNYDDDGIPEVEFTTEFEVNEIFYKLNRLATKLKKEILPVNVIIKDIIGEFIYFNKFNLRSWSDVTYINSLEINDNYDLLVNQPLTTEHAYLIRDIKTLYRKLTNTYEFPEISFNNSLADPYQNSQKYPVSELNGLMTAVEDYYSALSNYEFLQHGQPNPLTSGDDISGKVGCPVNLEAYLPDFTLKQLDGSKFIDFANTHYTIGNIRYRNGYEIEWNIVGPQGYVFNWRGILSDLVRIPHVLPHIGNYSIKATVYDMQGGQNVTYKNITVLPEEPVIQIFTKLQDKSRYDFKNLKNVTIGDLKDSPLYLPFANVVQGQNQAIEMALHYLDWNTYSNNFGVGNPQGEAEIFTEENGYEFISSTTNHVAAQWGTGTGLFGQPTLKDYKFTTIGELTLNRLGDLSYVPDRLNGFILDLPNLNTITQINFADWDPANSYTVTAYTNAVDLCAQLNLATHPQVAEYRYVPINGKVHAQAKIQDRSLHRILRLTDSLGGYYRVYTFSYPANVYSYGLVNTLNSQLAQVGRKIDEDLLFLTVPFDDLLIRIGETAKSTSSITVPITFPTTVTFKLTLAKAFDTGAIVKAISVQNPTDWIQGTVSQSADLTILTMTATSSSGVANLVSEWKFEYVDPAQYRRSSYPAAAHPDYWVDRAYIEFSDTSSAAVQMRGYLPSNYDQNSFSLSNLKIGSDQLVVPLDQPVFANVSNIDSKKECVWTLKHIDQQIAQIRSVSYFIWRFDEPGDYSLTVNVTDVNDNVFELTRAFKVSSAKKIIDYKNHIEETLNRRKALM